MDENTHPEELEPKATVEEDAGNDRRSFLTRAALGVAGAAGLAALGATSGQAAETSAKSKILNRIQMQMSQEQFRMVEGGGEGGDAYIKNSHSLYLKV